MIQLYPFSSERWNWIFIKTRIANNGVAWESTDISPIPAVTRFHSEQEQYSFISVRIYASMCTREGTHSWAHYWHARATEPVTRDTNFPVLSARHVGLSRAVDVIFARERCNNITLATVRVTCMKLHFTGFPVDSCSDRRPFPLCARIDGD